jgi:hypothetical protein
MSLSRRNLLAAAGGGLLAASGLSAACGGEEEEAGGEVFYGQGLVWNRDLDGVAGDVKLSFALRVDLDTGTGFGTANDPTYPEWNLHFAIDSTEQEKIGGGEKRFAMFGVVTRANDSANVNLPVRILAETKGDTTVVAIAVGDLAFAGAGLVVIAIIAILLAQLVPAVQQLQPATRPR